MKKLICALIGVAALVAYATTYIQTSSTGTAPWKPVKDSVSLAHLADSALHAPPSAYADSARASKISDSSKVLGNYARSSALHDTALTLRAYSAKTWADSASANSRHWIDSTGHVDSARIAWFAHAATYADSSRASGLADSAKRAGWAPLDSGRVRGIVSDTAATLRTYIGSASTTGNAATATKLATARTITTSGDVTGTPTAFDGTANITIPTTLPTLLTAGSAGSATAVPTLTWDAKGRLTAVGSATISIPHTQISDWSTATSSYWSSSNHPTVLDNYGITSSDATLDGRYLQLIGGILTGSLFGVNSYLNANENTHDIAPVLTLTNSIYTLGTTLLLAAGTGSTSEIGFSNIGKPAGNQRWNVGVYNDIFYIGGNPTNNTGNLNPYTFSRSGNLGVYGSVTAASFIGPLSGNASTASKLATARTIAITGDGSWSVSFDGSANVSGAMTLTSLLTAGSAGSATTVPTLTWDAKGRLTAAGSAAISIPHTQISDWSTATSGFQPTLGFTPVQQGGGASMGGNKVYIGWGTDQVLRLQVDATNFGVNWPININGTAAYASSVAWSNVSGRPTALSSFTNDSGYLTGNQKITLSGAVTGSGTTSIATSFANTHLAGINQDLTTTSSPTFAGIAASNSYYGVVGIATSDAQKWYLVATVDITTQYGSASAVIRFNSAGSNGASGLVWQWAGSCFIRAKQQSAMSNSLDNFTIGWNYCHGFNPSSAVIGVKTTDNASHKIVNIYLLCPAGYDGMSWQIDNLTGSITASGVGTNYVTTLPTGLATYTGASAIWSDWTNITVPGSSTFTGPITANGGITGNLTGHASLDIPLTGSSAITGSLNPIGSTYSVGSSNAPWGEIHAYAIAAHTVFYGNRLESTGNTLSLVGGTSVAINIGNSNLLNISNSSTTIYNPLTVSGLITANGGIAGNLTGHASLDIPLTGSSAIAGDLTPSTNLDRNLGSFSTRWNTAYINTVNAAIINSPINTNNGASSFTGTIDFGGLSTLHVSYLTTNSARTLSPYSGNLFVYTVSQTTTQTMQDGTIVGEIVIIKNAQNSSTLVLTGNISAGSSTITSLSTAVLVWNGSTWY